MAFNNFSWKQTKSDVLGTVSAVSTSIKIGVEVISTIGIASGVAVIEQFETETLEKTQKVLEGESLISAVLTARQAPAEPATVTDQSNQTSGQI